MQHITISRGNIMDVQIQTAVRFPRNLVRNIKRIARDEGSTLSQFIRTAVIKELNARKHRAA